jgi:hypothetical protein
LAQRTSVRDMPWLLSISSSMESPHTGSVKLGQPVPESNLVVESNSTVPQQTHR